MLNKLLNLLFILCFFTLSNCNLDEAQTVLDDYDLSRVSINVNFINEDKKLNLGIKKLKIKEGKLYQYNNPDEVLSIKEISNTYVTWNSNLGHEYVTVLNPFIPAVTWYENINSIVGRRIITDVRGKLFPLKENQKISFIVDGIGMSGTSSWRSKWSCLVIEKTKIQLWDEEEVWKVLCSSNTGKSITQFFSEDLDVIVRTITIDQGNKVQRDLVAMQ